MRAVLQPDWGTPEVLRLSDVPLPSMAPDQVLIRVKAASVHKGDWHMLTGKPYLIRIAGFGFSRPKKPIPGMAVAGTVVAVGEKVQGLRVGDDVFGELNRGGFAEYVCARPDELALKPAALSFEEAAALPVSSTTALQALRDAGQLKPGQTVLVNGGAGGVGTFAIQLARAMGAEVSAVCSTANLELVRSLGATPIDYTKEDFTRGSIQYDLILDLVGSQSAKACRRVLKPTGKLLAVAGGIEHEWTGPLFPILSGLLSNLFSSQKFVPVTAKPRVSDLEQVCAFIEKGQLKPVIERRYRLDQVAEALVLQGQGRSRGKSVITL
jgi:NADPH:quinone reductase-like Zn-dependent oxidoreductase